MIPQFSPGEIAEHDQAMAMSKDNLATLVMLAKAHTPDPRCAESCVGTNAMRAFDALDGRQQLLVALRALHHVAHAIPADGLDAKKIERAVWAEEIAGLDSLIAECEEAVQQFTAITGPMLAHLADEGLRESHPVIVAEANAKVEACRQLRAMFVKRMEGQAP